MFGGNCIFTDVRGRTLLSSPAEVKLIFPSVFDVTLLHLPHLLLLPLPQRSRRIAIFHLPSCCLPCSLGLSFLLHSFALARLLLLPGCSLLPSASLFLPPLNRGFHRNSIFCFDWASVPRPGLLCRNVSLSLMSPFLSACLSVLKQGNNCLCRTCWKLRSVLYKQSAGVRYLLSAQQQIHLSIFPQKKKILSPFQSRGHRPTDDCVINSQTQKIHFKQLLSLKVSALSLSLPNLMDSHSKFRARCVEASTDTAVGVKQVCIRKKVCY